MRVLYLDPQSGVSGNMFAGALCDLGFADGLDELIARLPLSGVHWHAQRVQKAGIDCLHMDVVYPREKTHRHLADCLALIDAAQPQKAVQKRATEIFTALAAAEAKVHGTSISDVHFHEVGAVDAVVDILSAAFLVEAAAVDRILCGPLRLGFGYVECAHGTMPIPAPATANLLTGIPTFQGGVSGEFTTPTGAAILRTVVDEFTRDVALKTSAIGWGAGGRDAPHPNALRAYIGTIDASAETIIEARFHVDDMTGEGMGHLIENLMHTALDVSCVPAIGKKNRPLYEVRVLAKPEQAERLRAEVFRLSSTLGLRMAEVQRYRLPREDIEIDTPHGRVRAKRTADGRVRFEYDDVAKVAAGLGCSLAEAERRLTAESAV